MPLSREAIKTRDLCDYVDHFHELAGLERYYEFDEQFEVNVQAAMKMARLHDDLERLGYEGHVLEIYLVRLLFCLFSEDTGFFPQDSFLSYVVNTKEDGSDVSGRIVRLFDVLNMPDEIRVKRTQLPPDLCGRLKSDYRYSGSIVYNNFPWPDATDDQKSAIEKLAQDVLDARTLYPDSTLADMYGENSMPFHPKLVKAHKELDRAVMRLYVFHKDATEADIVAALMERYQQLTAPLTLISEPSNVKKTRKQRKERGKE